MVDLGFGMLPSISNSKLYHVYPGTSFAVGILVVDIK